MQAGFREMDSLRTPARWCDLVGVNTVQESANRFGAVRINIRQRRAIVRGVPFFAVHHASVATNAGIEVDHQPEFLVRFIWKICHIMLPLPKSPVGQIARCHCQTARSLRKTACGRCLRILLFRHVLGCCVRFRIHPIEPFHPCR